MQTETHNSGGRRRVVVTKALPGTRWREILAAADCRVEIATSREILRQDAILELLGDRCDAAIGQLTESWDDRLFAGLAESGGRAYANYAVGYNNVDVEAATRRGIPVGNTPGVLTETTAEMAVALLFAAARRVCESDRFVRDGRFDGWLPDLFLGKRLWGGTLGVVGAGRIGCAFARMIAPAHDMDLLYHDLERNEALEDEFAARNALRRQRGERELACRHIETLDELIATSDVVSLHVLLDDSTHHLIDAPRLRRFKPDAVLVNTSRGPVIDEEALVAHLRAQPSFRVGLDVFENEPRLAPGLAACDNAVIVPHIASATDWTREGMATLAACNVAAMLHGKPAARELVVERYLEGEPRVPDTAPSIVNADELELERG